MKTTARRLLATAILPALGLLSPDNAAAGPELTSAIRSAAPSKSAEGGSFAPTLSPDGRHALFVSGAWNLEPKVGPFHHPQVFLKDVTAGSTVLVSVDSSGTQAANAPAFYGGMSADGRFAVFHTSASNLDPAHSGPWTDIYLRDVANQTTRLVSKTTDGAKSGFGNSLNPQISGDGRLVFFESGADDLVANDANELGDLFVWDSSRGTIDLVSVGLDNRSPAALSDSLAATPDGRFVAFRSAGENLVARGATNSFGEIFLRDLAEGKTVWASAKAAGLLETLLGRAVPFAVCSNPALSDDGRFVAFNAAPTNGVAVIMVHDTVAGSTELIEGSNSQGLSEPSISADGSRISFAQQTNAVSGLSPVYVWNARTKAKTLVTRKFGAADEIPAAGFCGSPQISADGSTVTFLSSSGELAANGIDGAFQLYWKNLATGELSAITRNQTKGDSSPDRQLAWSASADGQRVAFDSLARDLAPDDANGASDVFIWDRAGESVALISQPQPGQGSATSSGMGWLGPECLSTNGQWLVFTSDAANLGGNDLNGGSGVFLRNLRSGKTTLLSRPPAGGGIPGDGAALPVISRDGRAVAFTSLVPKPGKTNLIWTEQVFVHNVESGVLSLASVDPDGNPGSGNSTRPSLSADGRFLAFQTAATNLVRNDSNRFTDIVVRDLTAGTNRLASVNTNGIAANGNSESPLLSPDGNFVFFWSLAKDIDGVGKDSLSYHGFLRNMSGGRTVQVDKLGVVIPPAKAAFSGDGLWFCFPSGTNLFLRHLGDGVETPLQSGSAPSLSFDGNFVAYENMEPPGKTALKQIKLMDRAAARTILVSSDPQSGLPGNANSSSPIVSADGNWAIFESRATNLGAGDANQLTDVYLYGRQTGQLTLASRNKSGTGSGNHMSANPYLSHDGSVLAFLSFASDLLEHDFNQGSGVFVLQSRNTDTDGDGLPDDWELANFGNLDATPSADPDGDGSSNLQEFKAGTNPIDAGSLLAIKLVDFEAGGRARVSWSSVSGKRYAVQYKDDLGQGAWLNLEGELTAAGSLSSAVDTALQKEAARYYRIVLLE